MGWALISMAAYSAPLISAPAQALLVKWNVVELIANGLHPMLGESLSVRAPITTSRQDNGAVRPLQFTVSAMPDDTVELANTEAEAVPEIHAVIPVRAGDILIDEREAMSLLKVSESTIKRMRKSRELPFKRVGPGEKLVRYRLSDVQSKM